MEEIKKSMLEVLENDIKENGTWAMQFMTAFYPDKKLQYLKEKIVKNDKKFLEKNIKEGDIIIRAYALFLKIKKEQMEMKEVSDFNLFLKCNDKYFHKEEYFGVNYYPKKWKVNPKTGKFKKSVIDIEEEEKDAFFDSLEKEEKKNSIIDSLPVEQNKKKKIIKKKKKVNVEEKISEKKNNVVENSEEFYKLRKERDALLKKFNHLNEKTDNLENLKDDFEEDYKITKAEVNKLKEKFTEKTGLDPDEFWKVKEFYMKYSDKEEILEKQLNKENKI